MEKDKLFAVTTASNAVISPNIHIGKLGEITAFYAVYDYQKAR